MSHATSSIFMVLSCSGPFCQHSHSLSIQVPAGLHADLQVQIFTLSAAQVGEEEPRKRIVQDIPIHTEVDILYLPVTANILSVPYRQF